MCMKKCNECGEYKPLTDFYKQKNKDDAKPHHITKCKPCYNDLRKKKYNSNPEFRAKRARQIQDRKEVRRKTDPYYWLHKRISYQIRNREPSKKLLNEYNIDISSILSSIGERPEGDYHLDHILPQAAFDYTDAFEVWACNHQKNLQWLPAKENLIKSDTYCKEELSSYLLMMRGFWDNIV